MRGTTRLTRARQVQRAGGIRRRARRDRWPPADDSTRAPRPAARSGATSRPSTTRSPGPGGPARGRHQARRRAPCSPAGTRAPIGDDAADHLGAARRCRRRPSRSSPRPGPTRRCWCGRRDRADGLRPGRRAAPCAGTRPACPRRGRPPRSIHTRTRAGAAADSSGIEPAHGVWRRSAGTVGEGAALGDLDADEMRLARPRRRSAGRPRTTPPATGPVGDPQRVVAGA